MSVVQARRNKVRRTHPARSSASGCVISLVLLPGAALLFLLCVGPEIITLVHWDRWDDVQITGRLVDPTAGEPHVGVRILTLGKPGDADDEDRVRERLELAQQQLDRMAGEVERGHDTTGHCPGPNGLTTSDEAGRFTCCVKVHYGGTDWGGVSSRPRQPPPFHGVGALLPQWPDGRRAVIDATRGEWTVLGGRHLHARLDMGTVRVPAP